MTTVFSELLGGCQCRAVRYRISALPHHQTLCHCTQCRASTGAPAVAWFTVPDHAFRLLQGEPRSFRSSASAMRSFCGDCGTQLTFRSDGEPEVDVTICSLDEAEHWPPADQTFARSRLPWMRSAHRLPEYASTRLDGAPTQP